MWIRILRLIFWPKFFQNGASNCFHMCSGTCMSEEKNFPIEKNNFFSPSSVWSAIFHKIFILQQCLDSNPNFFFIRIRIQPKLSDSFGFGSTVFGSDLIWPFLSDPHPWSSYASLQYNFLAAAWIKFSRFDNTYFASLMH
jgi:hypothetical protein